MMQDPEQGGPEKVKKNQKTTNTPYYKQLKDSIPANIPGDVAYILSLCIYTSEFEGCVWMLLTEEKQMF